MHQRYITILIVVLFAAAAFIGGYLLRSDDAGLPSAAASPSPSPSAPASAAPSLAPTVAYTPQMHTVTLTASGPSPRTLTVRIGDAVRFVNTTGSAVWPASDPHPAHTQCPWLDAGRGLKNSEEYTLVFTAASTCSYHNHLDPANDALRGTIIVR